jgi:hypothetical protein
MLHRILGLLGRRRRRYVLGVTLALGVAGVFATSAFAVHDTGAFELDGNAVNNTAVAGDDWDNVCHQVTKTFVTPLCTTAADTNGATAVDWVSEPNLNATIFTGGGSKDPSDISQWAWKDGAGGLPDKDNLLHSFAARYSTPLAQVLFFGSDRYDNSGDAQQGFWFFQNSVGLGSNSIGGGSGFSGVHKAGDLLVVTDFSNGGTTSTITVYSWDPTCAKTTGSTAGKCGDANLRIKATSASANCKAPNPDTACGIVNDANGTAAPWPYTDKSGNSSYLQGEFFEGGVNLTALGLGDKCFASVAAETRSSTSTTATLKDFTLGSFGKCDSSLTTQASVAGSTSIGTGSVSVSDSATVSVQGGSFTGNVQFHLRGPIGSPLEASTDVGGPVAVSTAGPTVQSATATVTASGDYCWSAHFTSTTSGVPDANDDGANECFTVNPVTPALPTTAGPNVDIGSAVSDTAALSGTANKPGTPAINPTTAGGKAGGTITFTLYGPGNCSTVAFTSSAVPVSGDGSYTASFTPTAPGTYHWAATYTGDSPNTNGTSHNSDCSDAAEDVVVNPVPSSMTTAQSFIPNDKATVSASAGGNLAGSVTFDVFESNDCSGTALYTETVSVSGASPQTVLTSNTTKSTTAADVSWRVAYSSTNPGQKSIPASCKEKSALAIDNDGTVSSP